VKTKTNAAAAAIMKPRFRLEKVFLGMGKDFPSKCFFYCENDKKENAKG